MSAIVGNEIVVEYVLSLVPPKKFQDREILVPAIPLLCDLYHELRT